jgi:CDP-Glycerol:Poly(glycerophosphate) glycerophosphotransferase
MAEAKILFICGSINQTKMMHKISMHFNEYGCYFTPYYSDGFTRFLSNINFLEFSILGGQFREKTLKYLKDHNLKIDFEGRQRRYDLVYTCSDLIIPKNIMSSKIILVQEGMTDPENLMYHLVKRLKLPRYLASTSTTGLSDAYDKFCVASDGYREFFIKKGVSPDKIEITGIPNFDNCKEYFNNNFPHKDYVLFATSDSRETFKYENRKKNIEFAKDIAGEKQLIFKLHPNEKFERATQEINKYAPGALIFTEGNTEHMIANCDILITRYSSVVYIGLALDKKVYSEFNVEELKKLVPIQNNGISAYNISEIGKKLLIEHPETKIYKLNKELKLSTRLFRKYKSSRNYQKAE